MFAIYVIGGEFVDQDRYSAEFGGHADGNFTSFRAAFSGDFDFSVVGLALHEQRFISDSGSSAAIIEREWPRILLLVQRAARDSNLSEFRVRLDNNHRFWGFSLSELVVDSVCTGSVALVTATGQRPNISEKSYQGERYSRHAQSSHSGDGIETLWVTSSGVLTECAWSNFAFVTRAGQILLSPTGLNGVTQRVIEMEFPRLCERIALTLNSVHPCLGSPVIMSSVRGVVPVTRIDGTLYEPCEHIANLQRAYRKILYGYPTVGLLAS